MNSTKIHALSGNICLEGAKALFIPNNPILHLVNPRIWTAGAVH